MQNWASGGLGAILAIAAAALLMVVSGSMDEDTSMEPVFEVALVDNTAEIEELETSTDAVVSIFQTEVGAPTIIYINELDPAEEAGADEGVQ
jgi:signal recognition particle receptor subunit beta